MFTYGHCGLKTSGKVILNQKKTPVRGLIRSGNDGKVIGHGTQLSGSNGKMP